MGLSPNHWLSCYGVTECTLMLLRSVQLMTGTTSARSKVSVWGNLGSEHILCLQNAVGSIYAIPMIKGSLQG